MTEFTNRYESAMIVAAAGFMLKQGNSVALAASLNSGMMRFMRKFAILVLALVVPFNVFARESTRLDSGWRFMQGDPASLSGQAMSPADPNWIDSSWQEVSVPHNWGWENAQQGRNYYRGPGWYRRELDVTPDRNKRYFLQFEAASLVADVYLNGKLLGEHRGGFSAFCFEITTNLSASGTNLLAVRVSNQGQPDIAPLSGDFSIYGGLYRPVHLIETAPENFTPTDHGSPGVAWLQTKVTKQEAVIDVTAQISSGTRRNQSRTLVATVLDANGKPVASREEKITLAPNVTAPYFLRVTVPKPHLWNGRKDPYLYKAVVELRTTNGIVDSVEQPLGLRFYSVDPDKGFFLNGQPYSLHGVNKHQDRWNKGWAVSEADLDEDISLIKEIGATVVRCAHYQHSDYFYSLCDKAGILVWAEIPQVNEINSSPEFEETSRNQLIDLIRQNVNHPSIFAWSLFNELRAGKPDPQRELQDLKIVANGEDPTRPAIAATCTSDLPQMNKIPDLLGWNIYPGWYSGWGTKEDFGASLDKRRRDSRQGGICISEYGAGANVEQHEQNPKQPITTSQWHPEEWQSLVHETAWAAMKDRPFVWGTFVWNMFDFAVSSRHEGGIPGRNDKGLVTYDRKIKKDAFYFYKANWSDEPVLYITSRRHIERTNTVTDVKIYSNAKNVELFINGISLGKPGNATNCTFIWKNAKLKPGENQVEARARLDGRSLRDSCAWTLNSIP
jgi:beta-galactosidase